MGRRRGAGSLYKQPGCSTWTIKYYDHGRSVRESTGLTDYQAARQKLNQRLGEVSKGEFSGLQLERITVGDLAKELLRDYSDNNRKSTSDTETRWRLHLAPCFSQMPAMNVSTAKLNRYVDQRRNEGAENATINRELAALKRAFNLGYRSTPRMVQQVPAFPHLKENPPRKGFATEEQYSVLCQNCDEPWLRALLALAYSFGFRVGELVSLRVRHFNIFTRTVTLDPGSTKNDEARTVALTQESYELLKMCVRGKQPEAFIFTRENGKRVLDFRVSWYRLCTKSGFGQMYCDDCSKGVSEYQKRCECGKCMAYRGMLVHDQRRSAVRNMVRRGVPERVAMMVSGHKTRSVFDRYNIVSDADLTEAARKIEQGRTLENGHDFGHDGVQEQSTPKPMRVV